MMVLEEKLFSVINVRTESHGNPFNSFGDISVLTKVVLTDSAVHLLYH